MAVQEALVLTKKTGTGDDITMQPRESALTDYSTGTFNGIIWASFAMEQEGRWQKVEYPGYKGVDAKDFRPGAISLEITGYIVSESGSMVTRYEELQTNRNKLLGASGNAYTVESGPFTCPTSTSGNIVVDKVTFMHFDREGGRQKFILHCTLITGSMT